MNYVGSNNTFHLLHHADSSQLLSWSCRSTKGKESVAKQTLNAFL